jgi:hypothetical protein
MIARDPAGIQTPDTSRGSCYPVGHPCLYLMSTSDQRSSCDDEPRTVRTVAAAVKFAEPASQVAGWPRRCETSGVQRAWGEK